jgi:hypothetical protein
MKKVILTLAVAAFAFTSASFADGAKKQCDAKKQCAAGEKKMCCSAKKGTCSSEGISKKNLIAPKAQQ